MKKAILFIVLFFCLPTQIVSQKNLNKNIVLANDLYSSGKYSEAADLFKKVYSNKNLSKIYKKYFDCLLKINDFNNAINLSENYYKKGGNNPSILIDLGRAYSLSGNQFDAEKQFNLAFKEANEKPNFLLSVASKFYSVKLYTHALQAYRVLKERNPKGNYSFQLSNIYSQLGETENMYKELIDLIILNESYMQTCKNKIRITISKDSGNENNILLKNILIKEIQQTSSIVLNEMLIWVFTQEEDFKNALKQEIAIDKRTENRDLKIFDLGRIAMSNADFEIAQQSFDYIIEKKNKSLYYNESIIKSLDIQYLVFKKNPTAEKNDLNKLIKNYEKKIEELGVTNETIFTIIDLSDILAFHSNEVEKAKELLINIVSKKTLSEEKIAYCKLKLGDILLIENNIWEAQLYYSQVEKDFKHEVIGQEAKFKKIQIDYYTGKFNWAQSQLNILKQSTSKLIANNAMELSLLIGDNLNLDTTQLTLQIYANAELLIFQNKYTEALEKFNIIENIYPNHSLEDDLLFQKAFIEIKRKNYDIGLSYLEKICAEHNNSILFDDALYKQAYVLDFTLEKYKKAQEKYEELLLKCPSSIFVSESRKRYRFLRALNN